MIQPVQLFPRDPLRTLRFRLLARMSGLKSLFVVLGPSGSDKSSFLRAGLIPRLQRDDRRFVVLGIVRPQRNALAPERNPARKETPYLILTSRNST